MARDDVLVERNGPVTTVIINRPQALELASVPQIAMLSDRRSLISQWDFPEDEAIRREIAGSQAAFRQGFEGVGRSS